MLMMRKALTLVGALGLSAPLQAIVLQACPQRIVTQQSLRSSNPGWTAERKDGGYSLEAIGFFVGPVSRIEELAPDEPDGGTSFEGIKGVVNQVCQYRGTDVVLSRPIPAGVKSCIVKSGQHGALVTTCR